MIELMLNINYSIKLPVRIGNMRDKCEECLILISSVIQNVTIGTIGEKTNNFNAHHTK